MDKKTLMKLLAAGKFEMAEDAEEPAPKMPLPEAQAMELRLRWESWCQPSDLVPGDLVVEKRGLGSTKPQHRRERIMIVWRVLDAENWQDQAMIERHFEHNLAGSDRFDCIVGELQENGAVVSLRPHELRQLERWVE